MRQISNWLTPGLAALLLLTACSDATEQTTSNVLESHRTPEPPSSISPAEPGKSSVRDPLAEAAFGAQQALLRSNAAEAGNVASERDARAAIHGRINLKFRDAVIDLKAAGVAFDSAQAAVNILNATRRQQGVFELQTTYQDPSDQFRIVDDFMTGGPFGVVLLQGTNFPQSFRGALHSDVLSPGGGISEQCRVSVPSGSGEKLLECRSVIAGRDDHTLISLAKAYLTSEMQ